MVRHYRGKFRSQTSDNMDRWKAETGGVREKRRVEERRSEKRKSQKKEAQVREKVGKSRNTVFPMICGSGGSKSRLAKAAGAEPSGQIRDEKCTPLWREAYFEVKMYKAHELLEIEMSKKCTPLWREAHFEVNMLKAPDVRTTFGSWDVEKVHALVVRSTFRS